MNTGPEGETMTGQLQGDFTFRQQRWSQLKRVLSLGKHDHPDVQPKECEETDAAPSMQPSTDCTLGACPKQSSREQSLEEDNINQKCQNWEESIQRMEYEINNLKTKLRNHSDKMSTPRPTPEVRPNEDPHSAWQQLSGRGAVHLSHHKQHTHEEQEQHWVRDGGRLGRRSSLTDNLDVRRTEDPDDLIQHCLLVVKGPNAQLPRVVTGNQVDSAGWIAQGCTATKYGQS